MSHFNLAIFTLDENPNLDEIMEPFFEGNRVEPYVKQAYFICRMKQTKSAIPSICNFNKAGISEFGSDLEQIPRGYANDCC